MLKLEKSSRTWSTISRNLLIALSFFLLVWLGAWPVTRHRLAFFRKRRQLLSVCQLSRQQDNKTWVQKQVRKKLKGPMYWRTQWEQRRKRSSTALEPSLIVETRPPNNNKRWYKSSLLFFSNVKRIFLSFSYSPLSTCSYISTGSRNTTEGGGGGRWRGKTT